MPSFNDPNYGSSSGIHTENGINYSVPAVAGSLSKSWTNTPNFRAAKKAGLKLATQQFSSTYIKHSYVEGAFSFGPTDTFPSGANQVSGVLWDYSVGQYCNWPVGHFGYGLFDSSVETDCDQAMLRKIKDSSVNLAQAFAERKQTANLLASSAIRIAKSARALRKGNVTGALNTLGFSPSQNQLRKLRIRQFKSGSVRSQKYNSQALANNWLEIQYGWKPLLSDVYGSAELLAKSLDRPETKTVHISISKVKCKVETIYYGFSDCLVVTRDLRTLSTCKKSITYSITSQGSRVLAEVGISNPVLLAWELVPFSFVVDWFLPIGNYLSTIDATAGCSFVRGTRSTRWSCDNLFTGIGRQNNGANGNWTYSGYGSGKYESAIVTRSALSSFPSSNVPSLKNPFSLTHVANALALLKSVFR